MTLAITSERIGCAWDSEAVEGQSQDIILCIIVLAMGPALAKHGYPSKGPALAHPGLKIWRKVSKESSIFNLQTAWT